MKATAKYITAHNQHIKAGAKGGPPPPPNRQAYLPQLTSLLF